MANKATPPDVIAKVHQLIAQGLSYQQIADAVGKSRQSIKCLCWREKVDYKHRKVEKKNEFCLLEIKQLDKNIQKLLKEYGIDNSPKCYFASELEIRQFGIRTQKYITQYNQPASCQS